MGYGELAYGEGYYKDDVAQITKTWARSADYLIQQYKESVSVSSIIDLHESRMKTLAEEIALLPMRTKDVLLAEGEQLNRIGQTVDAGRGTRTDEQFRDHIAFMQRVNAAGGEPPIIIEYLTRYLGNYLLDMLFDEGNAAVNIQLMTQNGPLPAGFLTELVYQLGRIVPAGVQVRLFHSDTGDIFAVADEGTEVTVGGGFSEEKHDLSVDGDEYFTRTTGGQFVDPITV
jgi:hypothetical protein